MRASSEPIPDILFHEALDVQLAQIKTRTRKRSRSCKRSYSASHDTNSAAWEEARLLLSSTPPRAISRASPIQECSLTEEPQDLLRCSNTIADTELSQSGWHETEDQPMRPPCLSSLPVINPQLDEARKKAWEAWEALEDVPPPFDNSDEPKRPLLSSAAQFNHSTRFFTNTEFELWKSLSDLDQAPSFRLSPFEVPLHPYTIMVASSMPTTPNQDVNGKEAPNSSYFSLRP